MNFICSRTELVSQNFDLEEYKSGCGWYLYLDKGWSKIDNYFFKGFASSWCRIFIDPNVRIETNKLRDFPIYHSPDCVTNFKKLDKIVPADGMIQINKDVQISYIDNFYPSLPDRYLTFSECHNILFDALLENIGALQSNDRFPVYIPDQGGIDTLTVRSVFDYLGIDYKLFKLPNRQPILSKVGKELVKNHWGIQQIQEHDNTLVATGFYGDEWVLRNPYYAHILLSERGVNIVHEFDKLDNCYMKKYFNRNYRKKCLETSRLNVEKLKTQMCNDFQIWHINYSYFFNPLKKMSLMTLLRADNQTIIDQVTDALLSKSIIERCSPNLLDFIDPLKNQNDPAWFPPNS